MPNTTELLMIAEKNPPSPRFRVADRVRVTAPGIHKGKEGLVEEIVHPMAGDFVYRYRVSFPAAGRVTFFGFELELLGQE